MITFKRLTDYPSQPAHRLHQTKLFLKIGKLHILTYRKPAAGINIGWDCKFWHTGWHLRLAVDGVKWTWNKTHDEV